MQELTEMDLAGRLTALLEEKNGGNQSELARFAGVTPQAVQQWMSGKTAPRGRNLAKVAEFLRVSRAHLQYGERMMGPYDPRIGGDPPPVREALHDGPPVRGRVPLISWMQAGDFQS